MAKLRTMLLDEQPDQNRPSGGWAVPADCSGYHDDYIVIKQILLMALWPLLFTLKRVVVASVT